MTKSGIIKYVNARPFGNRTLHSFKLENDSVMYALGEQRPNIQVGDSVSFEHRPVQNDRADVEFSSITVVKGDPAPSRISTPFSRANPAAAAKDDYWRAKEARDIANEPIIREQAARRDSITLVSAMVTKDLIPLPGKGKDNLAAVLGLVDDMTTKFLQALLPNKTTEQVADDKVLS